MSIKLAMVLTVNNYYRCPIKIDVANWMW